LNLLRVLDLSRFALDVATCEQQTAGRSNCYAGVRNVWTTGTPAAVRNGRVLLRRFYLDGSAGLTALRWRVLIPGVWALCAGRPRLDYLPCWRAVERPAKLPAPEVKQFNNGWIPALRAAAVAVWLGTFLLAWYLVATGWRRCSPWATLFCSRRHAYAS